MYSNANKGKEMETVQEAIQEVIFKYQDKLEEEINMSEATYTLAQEIITDLESLLNKSENNRTNT